MKIINEEKLNSEMEYIEELRLEADGHYNRKHYIDHFYGMVWCYENTMSQLIFLKDASQCYCFDCKHYCTLTIETIGQKKGFCRLFEMMVTNTKNVTCEHKDLNV